MKYCVKILRLIAWGGAIPVNAAVGEANGTASVSHYDVSNTGMSTVSLSDKGTIKVISIDSMTIKNKIGLVKIDVEGFEMSVLKGMYDTLKRDMPYITIEIRNSILKDIVSLLEEIGYKMIVISKSPHYKDCLFYT